MAMEPWRLRKVGPAPGGRQPGSLRGQNQGDPAARSALDQDAGHQGRVAPSVPTSHRWLLRSAPTWWNISGQVTGSLWPQFL